MKELKPPAANALLEKRPEAVLIDVRSTMEYDYVGHPLNALHIPIKEPPGWETDDSFADKVKTALSKAKSSSEVIEETPVLLLCRSGKRSELAANVLIDAGFNEVYNVLEGFEGDRDDNGHRNTLNGWRFHNLPWEQS